MYLVLTSLGCRFILIPTQWHYFCNTSKRISVVFQETDLKNSSKFLQNEKTKQKNPTQNKQTNNNNKNQNKQPEKNPNKQNPQINQPTKQQQLNEFSAQTHHRNLKGEGWKWGTMAGWFGYIHHFPMSPIFLS